MLTFGFIFWLIMVLWLLYGIGGWWSSWPHWVYGNTVFLFLLFFLLGWKVYGQPIRP